MGSIAYLSNQFSQLTLSEICEVFTLQRETETKAIRNIFAEVLMYLRDYDIEKSNQDFVQLRAVHRWIKQIPINEENQVVQKEILQCEEQINFYIQKVIDRRQQMLVFYEKRMHQKILWKLFHVATSSLSLGKECSNLLQQLCDEQVFLWEDIEGKFYKQVEMQNGLETTQKVKSFFRLIQNIFPYKNSNAASNAFIYTSLETSSAAEFAVEMNKYLKALMVSLKFAEFNHFFNSISLACKKANSCLFQERQEYLVDVGVCVGASLSYVAKRLKREEDHGIQLNAHARYLQSHHVLFSKVLYESQLLTLFHQALERTEIREQLTSIYQEKMQRNAFLVSSQILEQLGLSLTILLSPKEKIKMDDFLNVMLKEVVEESKSKNQERHFILGVTDFLSLKQDSVCEGKSFKSLEDLNKKVADIVESFAPEAVRERIEFKLLQISSHCIGHSVYLFISANRYELHDIALPEFKKIVADNFIDFKIMVLAWLTHYPYLTVDHLAEATQAKEKGKRIKVKVHGVHQKSN